MAASSDDGAYKGFVFPPDYASCISEITSCWSALEYNISMSIWHLAGIYPAIGACITSQIFTLDGRLKALQALLKLRQVPDSLRSRVNKFSERVRGPLELRNRTIHDQWFQGTESKEMLQLEIGAKGSLTYGFKPVPIEVLQADRDKIREAMREAVKIRDDIEAALPTLPEIPLRELHPTVLHGRGHERTRSIGRTFLLFPPKPSLK